jgi:hypothetical protein
MMSEYITRYYYIIFLIVCYYYLDNYSTTLYKGLFLSYNRPLFGYGLVRDAAIQSSTDNGTASLPCDCWTCKSNTNHSLVGFTEIMATCTTEAHIGK